MEPDRSGGERPPRGDGKQFRELERRIEEFEAGPVSTPTWGEVRDRLRARSAIKGGKPRGGAQRAAPSDAQGASAHDDRQGNKMKEPSRRGPAGRGPSSDRRPARPRVDDEEPRGFSAPRAAGADELLELADELEDQARALMQQARRLQRLANGMDRPDADRPARPRPGGFAGGGPRREGPRREGPRRERPGGDDRDEGAPRRPRADARPGEDRPRKRPAGGEDRPRKRQDDDAPRPRKGPGGGPPAWAPKGGKKRKP
jgi:hypothetical protein